MSSPFLTKAIIRAKKVDVLYFYKVQRYIQYELVKYLTLLYGLRFTPRVTTGAARGVAVASPCTGQLKRNNAIRVIKTQLDKRQKGGIYTSSQYALQPVELRQVT